MTSPTTRLDFTCGAVRAQAQLAHPVQDAALHRLQAVAGVGQGPRVDDAVGVLEEGAAHLLLDVDVDDPLGEVLGGRRGAAALGHGVGLGSGSIRVAAVPRRGSAPSSQTGMPLALTTLRAPNRPTWSTSSSGRRRRVRGEPDTRSRLVAQGDDARPGGGPRGCRAPRAPRRAARRGTPKNSAPRPASAAREQHDHRRHARRRCPSRAPASGRSSGRSSPCRARRSGRGRRPGRTGRARARGRPTRRGARRRAGCRRRWPTRTRSRSAGSSRATKSQPWLNPALGARTASRDQVADDLGRHRRGPGRSGAPCGGAGRRRGAPRQPSVPVRGRIAPGWHDGAHGGRAAPARLPRGVGGRRRPARRHRRPRPADPPGRRRRHPPLPRRPVRRVDLPALLRAAAPAERRRRAAGSRTSTTPTGSPSSRPCATRSSASAATTGSTRAAPRSPSTSATTTRARASARCCSSTWPRSRQEFGIARFTAEVLPQNRKMLSVFSDAGYDVKRHIEDGVVEVGFDIEPTDSSKAVAMSREHRAEALSVRSILHPRTIAVIGASRRRNSIGSQLLDRLVEAGFTGSIHPVNPNVRTLRRRTAYPSVAAVPGQVDLAVIAVPAHAVLEVVDECAEAGVKALLVVSSRLRRGGPRRGAAAGRAAAPGPERRHARRRAELLRADQQRPGGAAQRLARARPCPRTGGSACSRSPGRSASRCSRRPPAATWASRPSGRPATGSTSPATTSCSTGSTTTPPARSASTWSRWATRASSPASRATWR